MSIKVRCISHDMRILGGIVGVRGGTIAHAANENAGIPGRVQIQNIPLLYCS